MDLHDEFKNDINRGVSDLKNYVDHGRPMNKSEGRFKPLIIESFQLSKFKPLHKTDLKQFLAVDCSTYTLDRGANWGVYLHRVAYASVKKEMIDYNFKDRMTTVIGDSRHRQRSIHMKRLNYESKMAFTLIKDYDGHLLLDGGGFFGGERSFNVDLYNQCEKQGIFLLTLSKQSTTLLDVDGRDLLAKIAYNGPPTNWVYHPIQKSYKRDHRYGDVTAVKLCRDSSIIFRCDVMAYLTESKKIENILSPLTVASNDARCLGYPIPLFLAHRFTLIKKPKFLWYKHHLFDAYKEKGIKKYLSLESQIFGFSDQLHGLNPFSPFRGDS